MKFLLILLSISLSTSAVAQVNQSVKTEIYLACGAGGYTSPEIRTLQKFDQSRNYIAIRDRLMNGTDEEKLVCAIMLQQYQLDKKIVLTKIEAEMIDKLKNSAQQYSLCYTCTVHLTGTYAELFNPAKAKHKSVFSAYNIIKDYVLKKT